MSYFKPYIDSTGLHIPTYNDILEKMTEDAKQYSDPIYIWRMIRLIINGSVQMRCGNQMHWNPLPMPITAGLPLRLLDPDWMPW